MKKNEYLLLLATAAYSYLFYDQNAGINFLIFNLLFLGLMIYRAPLVLRNRKWQWAAGMCLLSSIGVFVNSSALAIISNIFSLILVSGFSMQRQISTVFSFLFSCYSLFLSPVFIVLNLMRPSDKSEKRSAGLAYGIASTFLVFALAVLFLNLYRSSNPLFAKNTEWLNLTFISFPWVIFTVFGFLIISGLYHHRSILVVENWENNLSDTNMNETESSPKLEIEKLSGLALFVLLNLMLLLLNIADIKTLLFGSSLPEGITLSDFVHNSVQAIILSILIAVALIMFLFRRNFREQKYYGLLRIFVCLWILQTFLMLVSTAARNQMYIQEFSLTDLRIGVHVWLILATIGLALTTEKILRERSNWFLIKTNVSVWFTILALSSILNWDLLITRYNLEHQPLTSVDFIYLFDLSDSNIPELIQITKSKEFTAINKITKEKNSSGDFNFLLNKKITHYLEEYKTNWQSYDLRDRRITQSILQDY